MNVHRSTFGPEPSTPHCPSEYNPRHGGPNHRVAGQEAARARVQVALKTSGLTAPAESRLVMVRKGRGLYAVALTGARTGADRCEAEFAAALASIQME